MPNQQVLENAQEPVDTDDPAVVYPPEDEIDVVHPLAFEVFGEYFVKQILVDGIGESLAGETSLFGQRIVIKIKKLDDSAEFEDGVGDVPVRIFLLLGATDQMDTPRSVAPHGADEDRLILEHDVTIPSVDPMSGRSRAGQVNRAIYAALSRYCARRAGEATSLEGAEGDALAWVTNR